MVIKMSLTGFSLKITPIIQTASGQFFIDSIFSDNLFSIMADSGYFPLDIVVRDFRSIKSDGHDLGFYIPGSAVHAGYSHRFFNSSFTHPAIAGYFKGFGLRLCKSSCTHECQYQD